MDEPDKYDMAIAHLAQHPEQVLEAWYSPRSHKAGCLFYPVIDTFKKKYGALWHDIGCLVTIRAGKVRYRYAFKNSQPDPELTAEIKADNRLPAEPREITVDHLPVFAEWQRNIDKRYNRN